MSGLMSDIAELLQKIGMSNCCLGDMIHDGHKVDDPKLPFWEKKYRIMDELAKNLRDRERELSELESQRRRQ